VDKAPLTNMALRYLSHTCRTAKSQVRVLFVSWLQGPAADPADIRLGRTITPHVDAEVHLCKQAPRPGELEPGGNLFGRAVPAQLGRADRFCPRRGGELAAACLELAQRPVERLEVRALDARPVADSQRPDSSYR
jgi:hypothetical protein